MKATGIVTVVLGSCLALAGHAAAQTASVRVGATAVTGGEAGKAAPPRTITLQQMVEPSFRIQPIVRRIEARRGEVVAFAFTVESSGREVHGEAQPIALRQEEMGTVTLDESSPPPDAVKLSSPKQFTVAQDKPFEIAGELRVPQGKAKFYSFGIVVRDQGQRTEFSSVPGPDGKPRTQAGVRFVTQYLLRCDVEVTNASGDDLKSLQLTGVTVVEREGLPVVQACIENPTGSTFEFRAQARLAEPASGPTRPFHLIMPIRASLEEPERTLVRLLPKGRIRVESPLDWPLLPGEPLLQLQLAAAHEIKHHPPVRLAVAEGQFPAQDVRVGQVGKTLSITPAQIELGQIRGGRRSMTLTVQNHSPAPLAVRLAPTSLAGEPLPGLQLVGPEFSLPAGRSRKVTLLLHSQKDVTRPAYGFLAVQTTAGGSAATTGQLPIVMLYGPHDKSNLALSDLALRAGEPPRTFLLAATNKGAGFTPIDATLFLSDELGNTTRVRSGYGRWLRPGETREVVFQLAAPLPPGTYQVKLAVKTHDDEEPLGSTTVIRIPAPPTSKAAEKLSSRR